MPEFAYTARATSGQNESGTVTAANRHEALRTLADRALFPLQLADQKSEPLGERLPFPLRRKIKPEVLADTFTQLSDLLENGVPLLDALRILAAQATEPRLADVLTQVKDQVADGTNLDTALEHFPDVFPNLSVSMVRAGLEGAFLEEALQRVSSFLRKQDALRAQVIGALTYPLILAVGGLGVTLFLVIFVVPMFQGFFDRLERAGTGLPAVTVILLALSHFLLRYGLFVAAGCAGLAILARKLLATEAGLDWADRWKLRIPLAGTIFHESAVSRFCRVLGTLLRNGVPILKSLEISSGSSGNRLLSSAIIASAEHISTGELLSRPLAESGLIPAPVMAMIRVAEESNSLDDVLVKIADRMDQKIQRRLDVMVRMVEPMMLLLIGGMVMFIIIGILLPVFDLNSTFD